MAEQFMLRWCFKSFEIFWFKVEPHSIDNALYIVLVILSACTFNGALFRLANPPKGKKYEILNNKNSEKLNEKWVKSSEMSQISKGKDLQQG